MYLKLDKQNMEVTAVCGVLESYSPSEEVREMMRLLEKLKKKMESFLKKTVEPELARVEAIIDAENKKHFVK